MRKIIFPLQIRKAEFTDALNIASIQVDTWKTTYIGKIEKEYLNKLDVHEKEIRWKNKIIADDGLIFIALIGEKVVGFISGGKSKEVNMVVRYLLSIFGMNSNENESERFYF